MTGLLLFECLCDSLMEKISVGCFVCSLSPPHKPVFLQLLQTPSNRLLTDAELPPQLVVGEDAEDPLFLQIVEFAPVWITDQVVIAEPDTVVQCADHGARRQIIAPEDSFRERYQHVFLCHDGMGNHFMEV